MIGRVFANRIRHRLLYERSLKEKRGLTRSFLFAFLDANFTIYFMRNIVEFTEVIKMRNFVLNRIDDFIVMIMVVSAIMTLGTIEVFNDFWIGMTWLLISIALVIFKTLFDMTFEGDYDVEEDEI